MGVITIAINLLLLGTIAFLLWKRNPGLRLIYWPAWVLKLGAGLLLGLLYTYYYAVGDTFSFFNDGVVIANLARKDFLSYFKFLWSGDPALLEGMQLMARQSRSIFLSKTISLLNLLTFDNYWLTSLYMSSLSFAASCYLVTTIARYFAQLKTAAVIAFLLFPSVVFWGGGVIKESLALAALYFLVAVFLQVWHRHYPRVGVWLLALVGVWVLLSLRYYFAAVFLPVVFATACMRFIVGPRMRSSHAAVEIICWMVTLLFPVVAASIIHPNFHPHNFLSIIVANYDIFQRVSQPGDAIVFAGLNASMASVAAHTPQAWVSGMFRPFPWEADNIFQALMAAENMALLIATLVAIPAIRHLHRSPYRLLLVALIVYTGILCVFITLSTPNFGTLCRYRIGYIPFFAFLVLIPGTITTTLNHWLTRFTKN
jgi:hypothetical protein